MGILNFLISECTLPFSLEQSTIAVFFMKASSTSEEIFSPQQTYSARIYGKKENDLQCAKFFAFLLVGKQINLRYEVFQKKLFCQRITSSYLLRGWYMKMMIPFQPLHYLRPSVNPNLYKYYFTQGNGKLSSPSNNSYGENNDNRNSNPLLSNLSHYALLHIEILVSKCWQSALTYNVHLVLYRVYLVF